MKRFLIGIVELKCKRSLTLYLNNNRGKQPQRKTPEHTSRKLRDKHITL